MADQHKRADTGRGRPAQDDSTGRWRSPIRGPWLTSVLGAVLLVGIPVEFITGLLSYAAYNPKVGSDPNPAHGPLGWFLFGWVTSPAWAYRAVEGTHVVLGLVLVPVVLAKLWSVMPKLFRLAPRVSPAYLLERFSLVLLVGGVVFEFFTGILDINYWNVYRFDFYTGHFDGAWLFIAGFLTHAGVKLAPMCRALRSRRLRDELRTGLAETRPEPPDASGLVARYPAPATISRRGALALVGGSSLAVFVLTAGNMIGGRFRSLALLAPHNQGSGTGPNDFQVNHTAAQAGIGSAETGPAWRLQVVGPDRTVELDRAALLALPQTTATLPIACTEGWSTTQRWTGVALYRLAALVGVERAGSAQLGDLQGSGATLSGAQARHPHTLLALRVNGADLSLDHGFPARVMAPAAPGNYNRKWMRRITFVEAG